MHISLISMDSMFLAVSCAWGATDSSICTPQIKDDGYYTRITPFGYYDQAMESLPLLHPSFSLIASRRFGSVGAVDYTCCI